MTRKPEQDHNPAEIDHEIEIHPHTTSLAFRWMQRRWAGLCVSGEGVMAEREREREGGRETGGGGGGGGERERERERERDGGGGVGGYME